VLDLVSETIAAVKARDDLDQDLHLTVLPGIYEFLVQANQSDSWQNFIERITRQNWVMALSFTADALSRGPTEKVLPREELTRIRSEVDELFESVSGAAIDDYTRQFVLDALNGIRWALDAYVVRGVTGIEKSVHSAVGVICMAFASNRIGSKRPAWLEKFAHLIDDLRRVLSRARPLLIAAVGSVTGDWVSVAEVLLPAGPLADEEGPAPKLPEPPGKQ
jgi:hypothetical protein